MIRLQRCVDIVGVWPQKWELKFNGGQSVYVNVSNRKCKTVRLNINGQQLLPYANPAKYLGTALEAKENGDEIFHCIISEA